MRRTLAISVICAFGFFGAAMAAETEENPEDFMNMHNIEIKFHQAGSTHDLDLMLSLFADDATMTAKGKTYTGKDQIKAFWQAAPQFQPQTHWVAYTPPFRIKYEVQGDKAHLHFECLWMDAAAKKIAAHTNADDMLARVNGRWLIKDMKAGVVPEL
jgi:uncharacterized protein (TIGR02246 family)